MKLKIFTLSFIFFLMNLNVQGMEKSNVAAELARAGKGIVSDETPIAMEQFYKIVMEDPSSVLPSTAIDYFEAVIQTSKKSYEHLVMPDEQAWFRLSTDGECLELFVNYKKRQSFRLNKQGILKQLSANTIECLLDRTFGTY